MRSAPRFLLLVLATSTLCFFASPLHALAASSRQKLELSFTLEKQTITLNEPVVVRLRAENKPSRPASLDLGFDRIGNLRFLIAAEGGKPIQVAAHLHGGIARNGIVKIAPGETYTQNVLLSALYAFPSKGLYLIQINFVPRGPTTGEGEVPVYKSKEMRLQVLPRNPSQLKKVCENLVEKVMSRNAGSALESAKALSYVNDLVAVPYLEQAATRGPFKVVVRQIATHGLARISLTWGEKRVFSLLTQKDPQLEREISAHMSVIRTHPAAPQD